MKSFCQHALVVILAVLFVSACTHSTSESGEKEVIPWRPDLATARAESMRTHKPVFVEFGATWCGPCQKLAHTTFIDPHVATSLADTVPVRIDIDQHPDLAQQYAIDSVPALILMDEKGTVLKSQVGYVSSDEFITWLQSKQEMGPKPPADGPSPLISR